MIYLAQQKTAALEWFRVTHLVEAARLTLLLCDGSGVRLEVDRRGEEGQERARGVCWRQCVDLLKLTAALFYTLTWMEDGKSVFYFS